MTMSERITVARTWWLAQNKWIKYAIILALGVLIGVVIS